MSKIHKIVVFGGGGMIGSKVVKKLAEAGICVHAASRRTGVDIISGHRLDEVLKGVDIVIDASDVPVFDMEAFETFFKVSGKNIFEAEKVAGVKHHVTLSIVGATW